MEHPFLDDPWFWAALIEFGVALWLMGLWRYAERAAYAWQQAADRYYRLWLDVDRPCPTPPELEDWHEDADR